MGSIPGSKRFHGEGNGNPLQYSCLEKIPWTAHGIAKMSDMTDMSDMTQQQFSDEMNETLSRDVTTKKEEASF